jgi:hypothetical protein
MTFKKLFNVAIHKPATYQPMINNKRTNPQKSLSDFLTGVNGERGFNPREMGG